MSFHYTIILSINIIALLILNRIIRNSDLTTASKVKMFLRLAIFAIIVVIISEIVTLNFENSAPEYRVYHIIGNVIGFSVSPLVPLLIGHALSNYQQKKIVMLWLLPTVNFIFSLFSAWFPLIFWVNAKNQYFRGPAFFVYIIAYAGSLLFLFFETLKVSTQYQSKNRLILIILYAFVIFGTTVQVLVPKLHISWICVSLAMQLYYTYCCEVYHQIDGLTQLLNRRTYDSYLSKINGRKNVTVFYFDIDDFKKSNDQFGHPFGDFCLTTVASCIKDVFSKSGVCFRIGGDEFCVISKRTDQTWIHKAYRRFLQQINVMRTSKCNLPMVSIGYAVYHKDHGSIEDTIMEADQQMYCFKQQRKEGKGIVSSPENTAPKIN